MNTNSGKDAACSIFNAGVTINRGTIMEPSTPKGALPPTAHPVKTHHTGRLAVILTIVIWHDGNGSSFLLASLPMLKDRPLVVEDCDVIFARQSQYQFSSGSRIFNMRGEGRGEGGRNVIFRNIRVEDPRPTQQAYLIQMATEKPYVWPEPMSRGPGDLVGVVFQNIQIAAPSILGEPNILWGGPQCKIRDLTFDNVTIGGKKLESIKDFKTNEYVKDIHFK